MKTHTYYIYTYMNYKETTEYLFTRTPVFEKVGATAYKPGLQTTHALDEHFGHPHQYFKTIHVAGTNGKGSCSHTIAAIFGQVSFVEPKIDYKSNCGNISAGVAPFAINNGIVKAVEPYTTVRIHQVNTDTIINAKVEVRDGKAAVDGDFHIDGVPTLGSTIELDFSDSVGGITGKLLPTDNVVDTIVTDDGKSYEVSVVDAGIPTVFIEAKSLDMSGIETPQQIEGNAALMTKIEEIRGRCAVKMGFTDDYKNAVKDCPYAPFFAIVSPSQSYHTFDGKDVKGEGIDIVSRLVFMQKMHKTHPVTGTVCMSTAARIPGSIVNRNLSERGKAERRIWIGHPAGVIPAVSVLDNVDGEYKLRTAAILRTARVIMDGTVYVRRSRVE